MGGGSEIPMLISTSAIVGIGTTIANAKRIVTNSNFFMLLPPLTSILVRLFSIVVFTALKLVFTSAAFSGVPAVNVLGIVKSAAHMDAQ